MQVINKPVKNFSAGRAGHKPIAIVIHIAEGYLAGAYDWFNRPESQVSSHYMIGKSGEIWKFVDEENTAWHAGGVAEPSWSLLKSGLNPNLYTIAIEHEGFTGEQWTEAMYQSSSELIREICERWNIPIDRDHIIGHYQINSRSRDRCPGNGVDLEKLVRKAKHKIDPDELEELKKKNEILVQNNSKLVDSVGKLELELVAKNKEIRLLQEQLEDMKQKSPDTLSKRNIQLAEEIYKLQQVNKKLNDKIEELKQGKDSSQKEDTPRRLTSYTYMELINAIGNKLLPRRNQ